MACRFRALRRGGGHRAAGLTLVSFVRPVLALEPLLLLGAAVVALADARGVSPVLLIVAAAAIGAGAAVVSSADFLPR
jgi:hypothetical protein